MATSEQAERKFPECNLITLRQDDALKHWWRGWLGEEPHWCDIGGPCSIHPWSRAVSIALVLFGIAEQLVHEQWQFAETPPSAFLRNDCPPGFENDLVVGIGHFDGGWWASLFAQGKFFAIGADYSAWRAVARLATNLLERQEKR